MIETFIGKTLADKYRIDSLIRETDFGAFYHATHLLMEKPVAVKILAPAFARDDEIAQRFSTEARRLSPLSHPNILNVTDFGTDAGGALYIVFEDAAGEILKETIRRDGFFAPERAVSIARQIAAALSAAHIKGLVHRNLNSENVIVAEGDAVKVLDLATVKTGEVIDEYAAGAIEYLAPEQCDDPAAADARSDIYSLGVILYEMLAGEVPFRAESTRELMLKHAQEPPPPLSAFRQDLPPEIEPIVLQMLAKNPEMRHQTAAELIDDLNRAARHLSAGGADTAAAGAPLAAANNNVWKTAFVVLAGISMLSLFLIWTLGGFEKRTDPATQAVDQNALPVQPINPATGAGEQSLATIVPVTPDSISNSNMTLTVPETMPGGDGYNPWGNGVQPPPGAPVYVPQGGQRIDPTNPNSPFVQDEPGTIYRGEDGNFYMIVPNQPGANVKTNVNAQPTPRAGRTPAANANVQPSPAPNQTPAPQTTPEATPRTPPARTPAPTPARSPAPRPTTQGEQE